MYQAPSPALAARPVAPVFALPQTCVRIMSAAGKIRGCDATPATARRAAVGKALLTPLGQRGTLGRAPHSIHGGPRARRSSHLSRQARNGRRPARRLREARISDAGEILRGADRL